MPSVNNVTKSTQIHLLNPEISKLLYHFVCRIIVFLFLLVPDVLLKKRNSTFKCAQMCFKWLLNIYGKSQVKDVYQNSICKISIKNNSKKFLTLSKLFVSKISQQLTSHFFVNITLRIEVAIKITSQSSIIIACSNCVAHKHFKGVLAVQVLQKFTWATSFQELKLMKSASTLKFGTHILIEMF